MCSCYPTEGGLIFKERQPKINDLEKWLTYKPWVSDSNYTTYIQAISEARIPALDLSMYGFGSEKLNNTLGRESKLTGAYLVALNKFMDLAPKPYLLPMTIWNEYGTQMESEFLKMEKEV